MLEVPRGKTKLLLGLVLSALLVLGWSASQHDLDQRLVEDDVRWPESDALGSSSVLSLVPADRFVRNYVANYPHNLKAETARFLAAKAVEYRGRRAAVEASCEAAATAGSPDFGSKIRENSLVWDPIHGVSYCQIPKVLKREWTKWRRTRMAGVDQ
jgi:hypothetical protein